MLVLREGGRRSVDMAGGGLGVVWAMAANISLDQVCKDEKFDFNRIFELDDDSENSDSVSMKQQYRSCKY